MKIPSMRSHNNRRTSNKINVYEITPDLSEFQLNLKTPALSFMEPNFDINNIMEMQ
jgi:hypothetical protein